MTCPPRRARRLLPLLLGAAIGCNGSSPQAEPMTATSSNEIYATAGLLGFWQFAAADGRYFGVLERGDGASTLAVGRLRGGRAEIVKRVTQADTSIRAIDARVIGQDLVFVTELNRITPLQLVFTSVASLIDPAVPRVPFGGLVNIELSRGQAEQVQLPLAMRWHVADVLPPASWLFSPRLTRGATAEPEVVANAADGSAVVVARNAEAGGPAPVANAIRPQAVRLSARRLLAYLRAEEPYYPFWSLPRYNGDAVPAGDLYVSSGDAEENLSAASGLGSIAAFALTVDTTGAPWIFAATAAAPSELVALRYGEQGWLIGGRMPQEGRVQRITAEQDADGWHIVYAVRENAWSLRYQMWSGR
jgi:hypothetical protein